MVLKFWVLISLSVFLFVLMDFFGDTAAILIQILSYYGMLRGKINTYIFTMTF